MKEAEAIDWLLALLHRMDEAGGLACESSRERNEVEDCRVRHPLNAFELRGGPSSRRLRGWGLSSETVFAFVYLTLTTMLTG